MEKDKHTTQEEAEVLSQKGSKPPTRSKWKHYLFVGLALAITTGLFWQFITPPEKEIKPVSLDKPFEDGYAEDKVVETEEKEIAQTDCMTSNMASGYKDNIEEVCEKAIVIECPEGMELNEGQIECIEYLDTETEEKQVEPLRKLTAEQDKVMRKLISYLLNLYGNDKYLANEETYKEVMKKVLAPSYYKDKTFENTYQELKVYNERTSDIQFVYSTVDVISTRDGINFDVFITGTWNYKENGKQKSQQRDLLLQVQELPNQEPLISFFKFTP